MSRPSARRSPGVDLPPNTHQEPEAEPVQDALKPLLPKWHAVAVRRAPQGGWHYAELDLPDEVLRQHLIAPVGPADILDGVLGRIDARYLELTSGLRRRV